MSGNTFGKQFKLTSFGESHGEAIGGIIDGCPANLKLSESDLQTELDRRKPGTSRYTTPRKEADQIKILSGVFEGKTTGTPIAFMIENQDTRSQDYSEIQNLFRPGHADFTYHHKYGHRDYRGGGRSSARETAVRVAGGAIAKKYLLEKHQIQIRACLTQLGKFPVEAINWELVSANPFFSPDQKMVEVWADYLKQLKKQGDSTGAKVYLEALNLPIGLGEPVFDKLDAQLAFAFMGINAVKGVEIGAGFDSVAQLGSEHRDEITPEGFLSNHAGGVLGGISTGQTVSANLAFKPTSSIALEGRTIDIHGHAQSVSTKGRHDPCVGIRAVPIVEAMAALVIMDLILIAPNHHS